MKKTELQIRSRVTGLNMGPLKKTPVGLVLERTGHGYSIAIKYRVNGHIEGGINEATASEASAFVDGIAAAVKYIVED